MKRQYRPSISARDYLLRRGYSVDKNTGEIRFIPPPSLLDRILTYCFGPKANYPSRGKVFCQKRKVTQKERRHFGLLILIVSFVFLFIILVDLLLKEVGL